MNNKSTRACECEHRCHLDMPAVKSPKGNPGHRYWQHFTAHELVGVRTPFGIFLVCPACASDCYAEYRTTSQVDQTL